MAKPLMLRFAKWHIWLGWLVGFPILMWMATGLFMAAKPMEEVRGNHLRIEQAALPLVLPGSELATPDRPLKDMRVTMQDGRPIAILTGMDGSVSRVVMETGEPIAPVDANTARAIASEQIVGGDSIATVRRFSADDVPFDFRRAMPVWQVSLEDGTNVYIGEQTGEIEAVRTQWWRMFDFMWGLHIMDLQAREETSHPILILFAVLGLIGALLGCVLMFRRRKAKVSAQ